MTERHEHAVVPLLKARKTANKSCLQGVAFVCTRFCCRVCLHLVLFVAFVCTRSLVAFVCTRFPVCSLRSTFTKKNLVAFVCTWSHLSRLFAPGFRKILSRLLAPTGCKQTRHYLQHALAVRSLNSLITLSYPSHNTHLSAPTIP